MNKTRQIDEFSKRLDKIFEDAMPTKAQILDAFHKSNPNSMKPLAQGEDDIGQKIFTEVEIRQMARQEIIKFGKLFSENEMYYKDFIKKFDDEGNFKSKQSEKQNHG